MRKLGHRYQILYFPTRARNFGEILTVRRRKSNKIILDTRYADDSAGKKNLRLLKKYIKLREV